MHRLAPAFRSCFRCVARPWIPSPIFLARRPLASSSHELPSEASTADVIEEPDLEPESMGEEGSETPRSYRAFMEKIGFQYRFARPQNWLGQKGPFPMNPSFRPPPPISDHQRELMWRLFSRKFTVVRLAKRFGLSRKRVDAILRLKGMEKDWIKGKELQTGFLQGMERLLSAQTHAAIPQMTELLDDTNRGGSPEILPERLDVHKADMLEHREKRDATPYRYERSYWESIPEDADEPILPNILQHVKQRAEVKKILEEQRKKKAFMRKVPNTHFMRRRRYRPNFRVLTKVRKHKPSTKFVDVGAEFVNVKELTKRASVAARKSNIRANKALEKEAALNPKRRTN